MSKLDPNDKERYIDKCYCAKCGLEIALTKPIVAHGIVTHPNLDKVIKIKDCLVEFEDSSPSQFDKTPRFSLVVRQGGLKDKNLGLGKIYTEKKIRDPKRPAITLRW